MFKVIKHIAFILLVLSSIVCSGQGVRFQFYRTKACSTIEQLDTAYSLFKIPRVFDTSYTPKAGTVYLPVPGRYGIFSNGPLIDTVLDICDTGFFVFRFKEPDHGLYVTGAFDEPALYSRCDSLLNGYQEYHSPNGDLEMRGTFKGGYRMDSVVTFYPNGQTRKRVMRYPKVIIITEFDSLGHKISVDANQNKSFMTYRESHHEEFYPDGKIKRKESSVKQIKRMKEFYSNGRLKLIQTKNYRTEYYDNSLKKITWTWTYKRDHVSHSKDFTICKTEYDTAGQISRKTTYYQGWIFLVPQPNLALKRSDWIVSFEKYEGGNKVFLVEDMDTKEFIKKYPDEFGDAEEDDN